MASVESSVLPQLGGTAVQIASPLTTSVDSLDATFGDTVAAVTAPFAVTVPAVHAQPSPAVTGEAASPTPGGDSSADGSVTSGTPPGPAALPDPAMADPRSPTDSALAAIAEFAPDVRVLASAAVLALAAAAMVGPRASGSGTDVSMVFTNVRLLPCVVKESLARHVEMLTALAGADGGSGAAAVSQTAGLGSASGTQGAIAKWSPSPAERVLDALDAALGAFRDGFEQAIVDEREDADDFRDSRLMMQLGMLLGFVYVGFLSVWFWATRLRGTDRRRHYVR